MPRQPWSIHVGATVRVPGLGGSGRGARYGKVKWMDGVFVAVVIDHAGRRLTRHYTQGQLKQAHEDYRKAARERAIRFAQWKRGER